jgi:hypothetical protein
MFIVLCYYIGLKMLLNMHLNNYSFFCVVFNLVALLLCLFKVLCAKNYASRFSMLLHLEEIQQDIEIHEYDLDHVGVYLFFYDEHKLCF